MWLYWGRCGLVGGSVSLGVDFEVSKAQGRPSVFLSLLPVDPNLETLSYFSSTVCLQAAMFSVLLLTMVNMGQTSRNRKSLTVLLAIQPSQPSSPLQPSRRHYPSSPTVQAPGFTSVPEGHSELHGNTAGPTQEPGSLVGKSEPLKQ